MNSPQLYWAEATPRPGLQLSIRSTPTGFVPIQSQFQSWLSLNGSRAHDRAGIVKSRGRSARAETRASCPISSANPVAAPRSAR